MKKKKKKKLPSIGLLKRKADTAFSLYIRHRDFGICYTCGKKFLVQSSLCHCGHFVPRNYSELRYDEVNNHCQCYGCNVCRKGNLDEYAARLMKDYGNEIIFKLNELKHKEHKWERNELVELADYYDDKLKSLLAERAK